jgi:asparagine synthetase B (glutamine-hydrolysing)
MANLLHPARPAYYPIDQNRPMSADRLTPLEVAAGVVLGIERPHPQEQDDPGSPRDVLERAILLALGRPPCLVSFSGGRDSSAVLAVAADVAWREGLAPPVPATVRFAGAEATEESAWQERVVSLLGLADWVRVDVGDELDCVGPVASAVLRDHGLLWPPNAHFHVPLFERAAGGTLLTGVGGDEAFGPSRWARAGAVLTGRARPRPRDALRIGLALAPARLRAVVYRRRAAPPFPWLRPNAEEAVVRAIVRDVSSEPFRWAARMRWWRRQRYLEVALDSLGVLAADADVRVGHPLGERAFAAALARLPQRDRYGDRTAAMRLLFSDVLPQEVLTRSSKARFGQAAWASYSRTLVAGWEGEGVDHELVDVAGLRGAFATAGSDARLLTVLQSIRLSQLGTQDHPSG